MFPHSWRTKSVKAKTSHRRPLVVERLEARELLAITQLTTGTTDHRWPSLNNQGDYVYSAQVGGTWQVFKNGQQLTSGQFNKEFPSISDDGTVVYFEDGGSGGIGWQVIRRSSGGNESQLEFSSRNNLTGGAHRDANKYSGIASNGTTISGYNFYDFSGTFFSPTQRFNVSGVGQLSFDFGGSYNYPDVNASGTVIYAGTGFLNSNSIYKSTTSGPFPGQVVAVGSLGRINDGGDIVAVGGDLNSPSQIAIYSGPSYTQTTIVGNGSWADIDNNKDVIFEAPDSNGVRQVYLFSNAKPDLIATSLAWNNTKGGVDFNYKIDGASLPQPTSMKLFWSDGTKMLGQPIYVENIPAGAQAKEYGPINVPGSKLKDAPQGTTQLVLVADPDKQIDESKEDNNEKPLADVRLVPQSGIDLSVLSAKTIGAIQDSLRYAGQSVGSISSTKRDTRGQAQAVYENIKKKRLPSQRMLYGNNEAMTAALDAYEDALDKYSEDVKKDPKLKVPDYVGIMTAALDDYIKKNPGKVSAHLGDFSVLQAVDISFTVACPNPKLLWEGIVNNPKFSKRLAPPPYGTSPGEAAFHVEVPQ